MMKKYRLTLIICFIGLSLGFRLITKDNWAIREDDPTLWIKWCDNFDDFTFASTEGVPGDDVLYASHPTPFEAAQTVFDDYNSLETTWIRLASYPADLDNPASTLPEDSTFTRAKAAIRTINICISSAGGPFVGGYASMDSSGGQITGCEIVLSPDYKKNLAGFISTLTHELGHCLKLGHSQDTVHAVMSYFRKSSSIRLQIDDMQGLTHLYPKHNIDGIDHGEDITWGLSCRFQNH